MNIRDLDLNNVVGIPNGGTTYLLSLSGEIESFRYDTFVSFLDTLGESDIVKLNINSYGGCTATASVMCDAIQRCPAYFIGELSGVCQSSATAVALSCDTWVVGACVDFMVHDLQAVHSGYSSVPVTANKKRAGQDVEYSKRCLKHWYQDFLTEKEFKMIEKGEELHFYSDTLPDKLRDYNIKRRDRLSDIGCVTNTDQLYSYKSISDLD
jgi:ATP-dependent protease ClpP protease subunit